MYIYLNGEFVDRKHATISVFDRGLLYGDGVFETMRSYNGNILWLSQHLDRLFNSAHTIMIPIKQSKQSFTETLKQMVVRNALDNGLLRVTVSRGEGLPGLDEEAGEGKLAEREQDCREDAYLGIQKYDLSCFQSV